MRGSTLLGIRTRLNRKNGRRDSNSRMVAWEATALPLGYARLEHKLFYRVNSSAQDCDFMIELNCLTKKTQLHV